MVGGHMYMQSLPVPTPPRLSLIQKAVADGKKTHTFYLIQPPKQTVANLLLKRDTLDLVKLAADSFEMGGN